LSCCCPKLLVPAMNEKMYLSRQTQDNIKALKGKGVCVMAAEKGEMACGDEGCGRMSDPKKIIRKIKILMRSHG
ncbi:MAG: bifunctional phosphopantothenoylcysteine decarboxylase/phosphopantothenate--cysteine ligase CoaBC, partial [Candidatus Aureabacteria bacterium]|nr:bifunctional phosphopantothenoylcysteine decarboxylase/phosphopantothenate--cysteine ligase CoaBC [Candidatus Auribacterota bacterium]